MNVLVGRREDTSTLVSSWSRESLGNVLRQLGEGRGPGRSENRSSVECAEYWATSFPHHQKLFNSPFAVDRHQPTFMEDQTTERRFMMMNRIIKTRKELKKVRDLQVQ